MRAVRLLAVLPFAVLASGVGFAQAPPAFEVASIHPSAEQMDRATVGMHIDGAQFRMNYQSLRNYVAMAFAMRPGQVVGPDWLAQSRFDVAAKIPDGVSATHVPEMLQQLLASRFQLQFHRDQREFPVYVLTAAKDGVKLKASESAPGEEVRPGNLNVTGTGSGQGVAVDLGGGSSFTLANNRLEVTKVTMESLANVLRLMMDRPVIDPTGVAGTYDVLLELTPDDYQAALIRSAVNQGVVLPPAALSVLDNVAGDPFSNQLDRFGLHLDSRKSPLDVIVIDSIRRTPTDN